MSSEACSAYGGHASAFWSSLSWNDAILAIGEREAGAPLYYAHFGTERESISCSETRRGRFHPTARKRCGGLEHAKSSRA